MYNVISKWDICSDRQKQKSKILLFQCFDSGFDALSYFFLGALEGGILSVISLFRSIAVFLKTENKKFFSSSFVLILFLLIILLQFYIYYKELFDILPMLSMFLMTIFVWFGNEKWIRIGGVFCTIIWIIYDFCVQNYASGITHTIALLSPLSALIYFRLKK